MKYKSCYSPYQPCARPCYNCCPQPKKSCCEKWPKNALQIAGSVNKTNVYDEHRKIEKVLYTFYLKVRNCTGKTLRNVWLTIDIRVLECCGDLVLCDCFNPDDVEVLDNCCKEDGAADDDDWCDDCDPPLPPQKMVDDCGIHVPLCKLHPGISIITVIVPLLNPLRLCPPPCSLLPSLFTLKVVKEFCEKTKVVFQTTAIVGCQPSQICCRNKVD